MKKTLFACGALALFGGILMNPATGLAAGYGAAGCGLGSLVFGDSPGIIQIFAATTHNALIPGTQTFGITSGTSNCAPVGSAFIMQETFVSLNQSSLSRDAAAGSGEYLSAFSMLIGCDAQPEFFNLMKDNHAKIFTPDAKATDILTQVRTIVQGNDNLVAVCKI